jgi:hypothetical protein
MLKLVPGVLVLVLAHGEAMAQANTPLARVEEAVPYADGTRLQSVYKGYVKPPPSISSAPQALIVQGTPDGGLSMLRKQLPAEVHLRTGPAQATVSHLGTAKALGPIIADAASESHISLYALDYQGVPIAKGSDGLLVTGEGGRVLHTRVRNAPTKVDRIQPAQAAGVASAKALSDARPLSKDLPLTASEPWLEVWVDAEQHGWLAWNVKVTSKRSADAFAIEYWISASDARVLARENLIYHDHTGRVHGQFWPVSPAQGHADGPLADLNVGRNGGGGGFATTNLAGTFLFPGGAGAAAFSAPLSGPFAIVHNSAGTTATSNANGAAGVPIDLAFNGTADTDLAQASAFYWVGMAHRFAAPALTGTALARVPVNVNINDTCNAFWNQGNATLNFFLAGGGCANSAYSDVVLHEFGHGIDQSNGGILDGGYSEGFGDSMALLYTQQDCVGRDFFGAGTCLRHTSEVHTWPAPPGTDVHDIGRRYSGFVWEFAQQLRKRMSDADAFATAKRLVLASAVANPSNVPDAVRLAFVADDDDGDLMTCSDHFAELAAAADSRQIPRPPNCHKKIFQAVYTVGDNGASPPNGIGGYDLLSPSDQVIALDYDGDGRTDLFFYRPGTGAAWLLHSNGDGTFTPVYTQGDPGHGIAGYDLKSPQDRVLAFDFNGDGKEDLLFYRPGRGAVFVARSNGNGSFTAVYAQGDPGNGIAGFDLKSPADRILAFDYNGDGKQDLLLYRPGTGAVFVARSNGDGSFTAVYAQGDPGNGIAGFDLKSPRDQILAFDYNGDGKQDLLLYRPGTGAVFVARSNGDGSFTPVYAQGDPGNGIAGYDLKSQSDRILAFDYNGDHKQDLLLYRPGTGAVFVARSNGDGSFTAVYAQGDPGQGIAGYDLKSPQDQVLAFDYNGDGKQDLLLYRPGHGAAWVAKSNGDGTFAGVYTVGDNGGALPNGLAGYDLLSASDRIIPFDFNGDKKTDLFLFRPGRGAAWVVKSLGD